MKIGFDVDGVLADFIKAFGDIARNVYGRKRIPENFVPTDWNFGNLLTKEELAETWKEVENTKDYWYNVPPITKSKSLAYWLDQCDADIWFITARTPSNGRSVAKQTKAWLFEKQGIDSSMYAGIIPVIHSKDKKAIISGMELDFFIDDHGPTVEALDTLPHLKACLLDAPWNQDAKVKTRVKTINDYLSIIA
jgi:hypothetical protein